MKIIYFDNAATSHFKPRCVKKAFIKTLNNSANPGRSGHKLSIQNSLLVWETRNTIAKHFNLQKPENVIFTKNDTEAINLVLFGLKEKYIGKNIVCSSLEHNSVLRPLHELQKEGEFELRLVTPENKKFITLKDIRKEVNKDTVLVIVNSISNVTGNKNEFEKIAEYCQNCNILYLLDNAQGAGHLKIDMKNIDFLTFSGHKGFLTPQGIGCLCINSKERLKPLLMGGTGTESESPLQPKNYPEALESGTIATPLISSLKSGIEFIEKKQIKHNEKIRKLTEYFISSLSKIDNITIYTIHTYSGVISFNINNIDSISVCDFLDNKYNIACRGGLHCAPLTHKFYNTLQSGIIRASISFKNTKHQINIFIKAIKEYIMLNYTPQHTNSCAK